MYTLIRTATVAPGQGEAARKFANDIATFISDKYGLSFSVHMGLFSDVGKIVWVGQYESLAHYEQTMQQTMNDSEYQQALQSSNDLFVAGSVHDQMMLAT